jgi:hypothetical protein
MTTIDYSQEPLLHVEGLKQYFKNHPQLYNKSGRWYQF